MVGHTYTYPGTFTFEAGGELDGLTLAYHTSPGERGERKVVWICHALTANSDVEDWWPEMAGPGKVFDTEKYYVVCVNILGSCYGSSGPSSINPATGRPWFLDFPRITVRDLARAMDILREHLGIDKIDLMIGSSIGGFQAIEYCIMWPDVVRNAVLIATLARVTPWLSAFEESQRLALEADPSFREAKDMDGGKAGLRCARSIAMLSYRSEEGYNLRQWEQDEDTVFAGRSASYQRHQGDKLTARFDAYSYWYLSYEVDSNNAGRGRGGVAKALSAVKAATTVVAIDSDLIFPPYEIKEMASYIENSEYKVITSLFGHDGFLLETSQISEIVEPILAKL